MADNLTSSSLKKKDSTIVIPYEWNSILSSDPVMISSYGKATEGNQLIIDEEHVCRMYIENLIDKPMLVMPKDTPPIVIECVKKDGNGIINKNRPFIRFMMDSIQPQFNETIIPMKNLTDSFVTYVFGQEPPTCAFSGVLLHTTTDNWSELFLSLYQYVLRASKLAELSILNKAKYQVVISYQNKVMYGSIMNLSKSTQAQNEQGTRFSFNFLIKKMDINLLHEVQAAAPSSQAKLLQINGQTIVVNATTCTKVKATDRTAKGMVLADNN